MSARVLVVDDILANVKLLEAKLTAEYFEVLTALNGQDALDIIEKDQPDIVLLDVMMPGMDGFEVCQKIKSNPNTTHIPVVMVTALDQPSDRVAGIEAGADDFLTKPVNDVALMARVRSLVRLKIMMDELRMRETTGRNMGITDDTDILSGELSGKGHILLVEDREHSAKRMMETLGPTNEIRLEKDVQNALVAAKGGDFDLVIVDLSTEVFDGLRLCSQLRSTDVTRHVPILVLTEDGDMDQLVRALDIGVNDYLMRPIDRNELFARVKTQLRRKLYADKLRQNYHLSLEMAVTDQLTGLYNRHYMSSHLTTLMSNSAENNKSMSFVIVDVDFFKSVNDTYGHDIGDEVLKEFATRLASNVRGVDLACRYGGEEFVVVMPDTDLSFAYMVAERLRQEVAEKPFKVGGTELNLTISIGLAISEGENDTPEALLRRADQALYRAKRDGRNRVVADAA